MDHFIHRSNVERFRKLLESDKLDQGERETILLLLAEEEKKLGDRDPPPKKR